MSGYHVTDQTCPDCASAGVAELLYSNGDRTLCSNPWCGYEFTREIDVAELPVGSQPPLL